MNTHTYNVGLTWETGRKGLLFSPEVSLSRFDGGHIEVATPPQFPKGIDGLWSPEHLLTAAVTSCFMTTFLAIAENFKLDFAGFACNGEGKLELVDQAWAMTEIILRPTVTVSDLGTVERVNKVLQLSEKHCLISNSIKSRVVVKPEISSTINILPTRKKTQELAL